MLYIEKIEEQYGDYRLQKKTRQTRDSILEKVPPDQLVCILNFMEVDDVRMLFSRQMIHDCFEQTPLEDTFSLLRDCKEYYLDFLSKKNIQYRIYSMPTRMFTQEMYHHYSVLERLISDKIIATPMVRTKFHSVSLYELASYCRNNLIWESWVHPHPLLLLLPFPYDVSKLIFRFL